MNSLETSFKRLTTPMASTLLGRRQSLWRSAARPFTLTPGSTGSGRVVPVSPVSTTRPLARRARDRPRRGALFMPRRPLGRRVPPPGERARQQRQDERAQDGQPEREAQQPLEDEEEEPEADEGDDGDGDGSHIFQKAVGRRQKAVKAVSVFTS